jgi:hypothetical protein
MALMTLVGTAHAAPGDLLRTISLPTNLCAAGEEGGTSLAVVPGDSIGMPQRLLLVISCWDDARLFFFDPAVLTPAAPVLTVTVAGLPPGGVGSLALRANKGDLLACANLNPEPGPGDYGLYSIALSRNFPTTPTTTATFLFNGNRGGDPNNPARQLFPCDGVAWDAVANRVYQKPDVHTEVARFNPDSTPAGAPDGTIAVSQSCEGNGFLGFGASGIAIGGQSLFYACDGDTEIFQVDKNTGTIIRSFPTAGIRTEDLECDPVTFTGVDAMWSKDFVTNQMFAFELPKGTCGIAGGAPVATPAAGPLCSDANGNLDLTDSDGDGLLDCWERPSPLSAGANGDPCIDFDGDGVCDYVLCTGTGASRTCARPDRKDVFVELHWLENHKPNQDAIDMVINRFAVAPVDQNTPNPGVALHVQIDTDPIKDAGGNTIPHNSTNAFGNQFLAFQPYTGPAAGLPNVWDFDAVKANNVGTLAERTTGTPTQIQNRLNAKRQAFRFMIFWHFLHLPPLNGNPATPDTTSGMSEVHGNDGVVSLGGGNVNPLTQPATGHPEGDKNQQAGTFMHELGHTLGLRHGGNNRDNCWPNYLSVMAYGRQFADAPISRVQWAATALNYSRSALAQLDRNNLNENAGIGGPAGDVTVFGPAAGSTVVPADGQIGVKPAIDWDRDNILENPSGPPAPLINKLVGTDGVTVMCDSTNSSTTHAGFADWGLDANGKPNLKYDIRSSLDFADGVRLSISSGEERELSTTQAEAMSPDSDGDGTVDFRDPCPNNPNPTCQNRSVSIDILPGVSPNVVDPNKQGTIAFAILGSSTFNVTQIDVNSLVLGGAPASKCKVKQINADGFPDLTCDAKVRDMKNMTAGSNIVVLTGRTLSGDDISGEDVIVFTTAP